MTLETILNNLLIIAGVATILYYVPFLIRRGWDNGENNVKHKKVCDMCWRDIDKVNKRMKEIEGNNK